MRLYVATKNAGKLRELRALFDQHGWIAEAFGPYEDVAEGDRSYADNAQLKAWALRSQLLERDIAAPVLGDDSGIEVAALHGRPGVLSARYGGPHATWHERRLLLRTELSAAGAGDWSAQFVCALHLIDVDGESTAVEARVAGTIAAEDRGNAGFSYDPAFFYPPLGKTFAELDEAEKNRVSHRAKAVVALLAARSGRSPASVE
jgi:XTP/dITP diphosphohydrolase